MLPIVPMLDVFKKLTHGQLDDGTVAVLSKDWRLNDGVLHVGHEEYSVSSERG